MCSDTGAITTFSFGCGGFEADYTIADGILHITGGMLITLIADCPMNIIINAELENRIVTFYQKANLMITIDNHRLIITSADNESLTFLPQLE